MAGYDKMVTVKTSYRLHWRADVANNIIYLAIDSSTFGWVGLGIAEPSGGSMPGADITMGGVLANGTAYLYDLYSYAKARPLVDTCQDAKLVAGRETANGTILEFSRPLIASDTAQDRNIPEGLVRVICAWGATDTFGYHGASNRAGVSIPFYGNDPLAAWRALKADPNILTMDLLMRNATVPSQSTTYTQQSFVISTTVKNILAIEPVIDPMSQGLVHHMVMYTCYNDTYFQTAVNPTPYPNPQTPYVVSLAYFCKSALFSWAGGPGLMMPPDVSMPIGGTDDRFIMIEVHYDNPGLLSGVTDNSGVRIYYSNTPKTYAAGVLVLGDPLATAPMIQAGQINTYEHTCSSTCTRRFPTPLNVFGSFLHMHSVGNQIWTTQSRGNQLLGTRNRIDYWDFGFQNTVPVNYVIQPGDRLNVHCIYDRRTATANVTFGPSSVEEMCMDFIWYYPRVPSLYFCGQYRSNGQPCELCGQSPLASALNCAIGNPEALDGTNSTKTFGVAVTGSCPAPFTPAPTPVTSSAFAGSIFSFAGLFVVGIIAFLL
eukprot:TRINITY_DN189_c0_g1_i14.p1 TRINITY_DN189_c0_g1~~TRINITY_DN189_c0_g1_i14.p1  ORF type:complete len:543 (-),score=176.56 TRINITY_DN189_c0_g1_i14:164-1792(-)